MKKGKLYAALLLAVLFILLSVCSVTTYAANTTPKIKRAQLESIQYGSMKDSYGKTYVGDIGVVTVEFYKIPSVKSYALSIERVRQGARYGSPIKGTSIWINVGDGSTPAHWDGTYGNGDVFTGINGETLTETVQRLIDQHDLPQVVFHSFRHSSVTYKLKLNGGDIKSVQGDSGHAQVNMVTDVYSHIMDDDRQKNAALLEKAFYARKDLSPKMHAAPEGRTLEIPEGVDMEVLAKALENPEMMALLASLAKAMGK